MVLHSQVQTDPSDRSPAPGKSPQLLCLEMPHLDENDFSASNGWLESFKRHYNIRGAALSGEAASVNPDTVADWHQRLPSICEGYAPSDIFNADETGLFYRTMPSRSLVQKEDDCKGGKKAKDRITALLACSATGEKLRPLVIGRSDNPQCFRPYEKSALPAEYFSNKKAWMTGDIFRQWLHHVNNRMIYQQRKILMFVDNCSAHPDVQLSHVKLVFHDISPAAV